MIPREFSFVVCYQRATLLLLMLCTGLLVYSPTAAQTNDPQILTQPDPNVTAAIPPQRLSDWRTAGIPGGIPTVAIGANVLDFGAIPNDALDDADAIQAAIDAVKGTANNAVLIPAGNYLLASKLLIDDSVVLRGEGPEETHLNIAINDHAIEVVTFQRGPWVDVIDNLAKGATVIPVADGSSFSPGTFFEIQQENDPAIMYTRPDWEQEWANQAVGQIGVVSAVDGNVLTLREPLNIDFREELAPQVRTQGFVTYVGIEDLHLDRSQDPNPTGYTVYWKNSAYTWMQNVHSEWTMRTHVNAESVYGCVVRDSTFERAHSYGGGGHGYGVKLGKHVTGCLVENNIFDTLRHSMMVQIGANGNVLGYNYSLNSQDDEGNLLPDISLHGHYPFANLFEGNIVEEIGHGDYWGPAGPHNTSLRNCVTAEGLWVEDESHGQNIIGNELTDAPRNFIGVHDDSTVTDLIVHGNYFAATQSTEWDPTIAERTIPDSYYLQGRPAFYAEASWPSIGADIAPSCTNPAKVRFEGANDEPLVPPPPSNLEPVMFVPLAITSNLAR